MKRAILHSDLNGFYASVETVLQPAYAGKPLAVCGNVEDRHGIVLAKSEAAKRRGITTGMTVPEALRRVPELIVVPPQFDRYLYYSQKTRAIYERFTDQIEPFGLDECWLDVTGSLRIFGSARAIAEQIRRAVREELGLTVSIGVSFNKVFAKLGSDMKKPDAVTEITEETFQTQVWPLPVNELIGISGATQRALARLCIRTVGDLAASDPECLSYKIGKIGREIWEAANGLEHSPVTRSDFVFPIKSIGHGATLPSDLTEKEQVWPVFLELAQDVAYRLRQNQKKAGSIAIQIRNEDLLWKEWETRLPSPTDHALTLAQAAQQLFDQSYIWNASIRSVALRAIRLQDTDKIEQLSLFSESEEPEQNPLDRTVDALRTRFGNGIIRNAVLYHQAPLKPLEENDSISSGSSRMKANAANAKKNV